MYLLVAVELVILGSLYTLLKKTEPFQKKENIL